MLLPLGVAEFLSTENAIDRSLDLEVESILARLFAKPGGNTLSVYTIIEGKVCNCIFFASAIFQALAKDDISGQNRCDCELFEHFIF